MRRATMTVFGLCLLAGSLPAQGLFGGPPEPGQMPTRFLRFDIVTDYTILTSLPTRLVSMDRFADATYQTGRFLGGLSLAEYWVEGVQRDWYYFALLPVHVGFVLWSNPKRTVFFYGQVPNIYVQVTGSLPSYGYVSEFHWASPTVRAALCCDLDYYGVGIGLEAGWFNLHPAEANDPGAYAAVKVRLGAFGIGF